MKYPNAVGPYSPYFRTGNLLFCSGQIGLIPETMQIIEGGIIQQTQQVIQNIQWVLEENGLGIENIVKTTVFLQDMWDYAEMNGVYAEAFTHKPARSAVAVKALPLGALVEIEVIAEIKKV